MVPVSVSLHCNRSLPMGSSFKVLPFVVRTFIRSTNRNAISFQYTTSSSAGTVMSNDTISYLTSVWGLPSEQANSAAKLVTVGSMKNADSVFKLLKSYGFCDSDFAKLISKQPAYVMADVENDLRPKIEYLMSLGIDKKNLPSILCSNKRILSSPLKYMVPMFDFLKEFLMSNEDLVSAIRRSSRVIHTTSKTIVSRYIVPNISTLQAHGVPHNVIVRLMVWNPGVLRSKVDMFEKAVKRVKQLGLEPKKVSFIIALDSVGAMSKELWQKKREIFNKHGWSEEEFASAFRLQPRIMLCSEEKISEIMEFLVARLGFTPSETARFPNLFLFSLEGRMVPRCSVLQVLMSSGKFKKKTATIFTALVISKSKFLEKYVTAFEKDVPDVVKAFQGQLELKGFTDIEYDC